MKISDLLETVECPYEIGDILLGAEGTLSSSYVYEYLGCRPGEPGPPRFETEHLKIRLKSVFLTPELAAIGGLSYQESKPFWFSYQINGRDQFSRLEDVILKKLHLPNFNDKPRIIKQLKSICKKWTPASQFFAIHLVLFYLGQKFPMHAAWFQVQMDPVLKSLDG